MTKLPNVQSAYVDDAKLTDYIFNQLSSQGAPKGKFLSLIGFDPADLDSARDALLKHAQDNDVSSIETSSYGVKYRVDGPITSPTGRVAHIRTVWHIDAGRFDPRFVTFKPIGVPP
jgi:hypothetical protein